MKLNQSKKKKLLCRLDIATLKKANQKTRIICTTFYKTTDQHLAKTGKKQSGTLTSTVFKVSAITLRANKKRRN